MTLRHLRPLRTIATAMAALSSSVLVTAASASGVGAFVPTPPGVAGEVTLLVRNQDTELDKALFGELLNAVQEADWSPRSVVSMAEMQREVGHSGLWTYKPWIFKHEQAKKRRRQRVIGDQRWLVFLEPATRVNASRLGEVLAAYDARLPFFLGRAIVDEENSIIHHYSLGPPYPLAHAGFALSGGLVRHLVADLERKPLGVNQQIEPVWELAKWIKDLNFDLVDRADVFCGQMALGCATWVSSRSHRQKARPSHGLEARDAIIAVKTVGKFHSTRVVLLHEIWGKASPVEMLYLSNESYSGEQGLEVIDLSPEFGDSVKPEVESTKSGSGHCAKMWAILEYLHRHHQGKRWYVVVDDDTLLNVRQLLAVLESHDDRKPLYVGERYGWAHREKYEGNNYITTGGGMAMTGKALTRLMQCDHCQCSSPDAPDDMALGTWFQRLNIPILHEEGFHQSQPRNFHPQVLRHSELPVSFHRYSENFPAKVPQAKFLKETRHSWKAWVATYFKAAGDSKVEL